MPTRQEYQAERRERYKRMYEVDDLSIQRIANIEGVCYNTIHHHLAAAGVHFRSRGGSHGRPKRVTVDDIAARVGVHTSTVRHALNGTGGYAKATREAVLKVAAELGYQPRRYRRGGAGDGGC